MDTNQHIPSSSDSCLGCGVVLQSEDPKQIGYIPAGTRTPAPAVCQRCFRLKHYNEMTAAAVDPDEFQRILHEIGSKPGLIVHIVDVFDFEGSLMTGLHRYGSNNPILMAVNKIDLLPKGISLTQLYQWIRRQLNQAGVRVEEVVLISAETGAGFEDLLTAVGKLHKKRDIVVVGATNVGKSSVLNRFIRDYSSLEHELTTSRYPGTTLDLIHIPLMDGQDIIDTPGLVLKDRYCEIVPDRLLGVITPDKPLKPTVYQLNEKQTLFLGGLLRFDFLRGERQSFVGYFANSLNFHRTKLETADQLYEKHKGKMLSPPTEEEITELPSWTIHTFRIPEGKPMDVSIAGLGWFKIGGKHHAVVEVHVPRGIKVSLREAMI